MLAFGVGCWLSLPAAMSAGPPPPGFDEGAVANGGFESGSLSPWVCLPAGAWSVTSADSHSGSYAAVISGPEPTYQEPLLQQIFTPPIDTSSIQDLSFWVKNADNQAPGDAVLHVSLMFMGGPGLRGVTVQTTTASWERVDVIGAIPPGITLVGMLFRWQWPTKAYPVYLDDVNLTLTSVPEPSTSGLLGLGALGVLGWGLRKEKTPNGCASCAPALPAGGTMIAQPRGPMA